jgi:transglutaminase-like putative cysteine protease
VEKAMAVKRGDCGVHAMLFIALCRASGVPARWQSGWVARPDYWNMHDWAEFYVEPYGWLPADPSVGLQKSDDPRIRDFLFGGSDAYRMIANLGFDTSFEPEEAHWRSDPVDSQKGEVQWRGGNLYFDQWDSDIKVSVQSQAPGQGPR